MAVLSPGWPWPSLRAAALCGLTVFLMACSGLPPLPVRPEPVAYADTLPIREPAEREIVDEAERFNHAFTEEVGQAVDLRRWVEGAPEALDITHFDEVVSSAWFEHRNGRSPLRPEEVADGAATAPGPDTSAVLTVVSGKSSGAMPGFTVRDARGDRYLVKLDPPGYPHLSSSADVITSRIFHAAGYHVPADYKLLLDPQRLVVGEEAMVTGRDGRKRKMTEEDLRSILERTAVLPDGRHPALASGFVPGIPKGPFGFKGRRKDDPNDRFHHEYRRVLRGAFILAAWLNHADLAFQNTMSVWIDPPGYLRHYLIDFGISLGSSQAAPHPPREEWEHNFALGHSVARLLTLGFHRVGWEDWSWEVIHPSIGWLPAERYDPARWRPNWPSQAWRMITPADGYWGAKLVASFTDEQIAAAIRAAGLPDPVAADTLHKILAYRRDRTVEHWFSRVTPIERPGVEAVAPDEAFVLHFEDLELARGRSAPGLRRYRWELRDGVRGRRWEGEARARPGAQQRLRVHPPAGWPDRVGRRPEGEEEERLATLRIRAVDGAGDQGRTRREATVFLRGEGAGYRVVGLQH